MCVSVLSTYVFIVERLAHKFGDVRKSPISQTEFPEPIRIRDADDLFQDFFIFRSGIFGDDSFLKFQTYSLHHLAVAIQRLIKSDPSFRASPIRRGEDLK